MRRFRLAMIAVVLAAPALAAGQAYPSKPIRLIVPYAPGGSSDIIARLIAQKLTDNLGRQVLVDNRAGAGSTVGTDLVAKANPDGYTLVLSNVPHAINATLYSKLPYDTEKDFAPVVLIATVMPVLVVNPAVPVHSVKELIELAKAKPASVNYASAGNGSSQHLAAELFKSMAGINMVHIPYKGGGPAVVDLLAGQVAVYFPNTPLVASYIKSGRLRAIAVTGATRSPLLPDIPTVSESGLPGYAVTDWYGVLAPAKTNAAVSGKLNAEINKILATADMKERLPTFGFQIAGGTPDRFAQLIKADISKWAKVIKESGAHVD